MVQAVLAIVRIPTAAPAFPLTATLLSRFTPFIKARAMPDLEQNLSFHIDRCPPGCFPPHHRALRVIFFALAAFRAPGTTICLSPPALSVFVAAMDAASSNFVTWLARNVLPHEPALRHWLQRRARLDMLGLTADDIVQETYARLARMPSTDHIRDPRAYVFRTAYSLLLQEVRRSRVVPIDSMDTPDALDIASQAPAPDMILELRQEMQILSQAIDSMPPKCRRVFILRKVNGYSQREIAEELGISENTVETHLARGVRKLMDFYQSSGIQPPMASDKLKVGGADPDNDKRREAGEGR